MKYYCGCRTSEWAVLTYGSEQNNNEMSLVVVAPSSECKAKALPEITQMVAGEPKKCIRRAQAQLDETKFESEPENGAGSHHVASVECMDIIGGIAG